MLNISDLYLFQLKMKLCGRNDRNNLSNAIKSFFPSSIDSRVNLAKSLENSVLLSFFCSTYYTLLRYIGLLHAIRKSAFVFPLLSSLEAPPTFPFTNRRIVLRNEANTFACSEQLLSICCTNTAHVLLY